MPGTIEEIFADKRLWHVRFEDARELKVLADSFIGAYMEAHRNRLMHSEDGLPYAFVSSIAPV